MERLANADRIAMATEESRARPDVNRLMIEDVELVCVDFGEVKDALAGRHVEQHGRAGVGEAIGDLTVADETSRVRAALHCP